MSEAKRNAMAVAITQTAEAIKLLRSALMLVSKAAPVGNGCGVMLYDARKIAEEAKLKMLGILQGMK